MRTGPFFNGQLIDASDPGLQSARMWGKVAAAICGLAVSTVTWACDGEYRAYVLPLSRTVDGGPPPVAATAVAEQPRALIDERGARDAGSAPSAGIQADAAASACTPRGARDCTSSFDNDCDGQADDVLDDTCRCVPGSQEPCDEHPGLDGRGPCRAGTRTCVLAADNASSGWSSCQGAVAPGEADSCSISGDDSDCDGTPNGSCPCVEGETTPCGPSTDFGVCERGTSTCVNGAFSACQGAVFPEPRSCASSADNDCDGRPDNTIDAVCTCVIGDTQVCGEHPGQDGLGRCVAGQRRCEAGPGNVTSRFGACTGSVGPAALDSCTLLNDDSNCDGLENGNCECVAGQGNAPCANDPSNARCTAQGQCAPCQTNADCSLVAAGRTLCLAGQCIARLPDGSPCQQAVECLSNQCRTQYPNVDGDQYPNLRGDVRRLCGNTLQPGRAFARADGQTDCCDTDSRAFPGAIPPAGMGVVGMAGYAEANACGNFDYDCINGETSGPSQSQVDNGRCVSTDLTGIPDSQAAALCSSLSAWDLVMPACGESARMLQCLAFGGFSTCLVAASVVRPHLCF